MQPIKVSVVKGGADNWLTYCDWQAEPPNTKVVTPPYKRDTGYQLLLLTSDSQIGFDKEIRHWYISYYIYQQYVRRKS